MNNFIIWGLLDFGIILKFYSYIYLNFNGYNYNSYFYIFYFFIIYSIIINYNTVFSFYYNQFGTN